MCMCGVCVCDKMKMSKQFLKEPRFSPPPPLVSCKRRLCEIKFHFL